jgi:hypothetical protein
LLMHYYNKAKTWHKYLNLHCFDFSQGQLIDFRCLNDDTQMRHPFVLYNEHEERKWIASIVDLL